MSDLKTSIQAAITSYVQSKKDTHTQVDVLRMIRDQASLLYECQKICDALDSDPFEELQNVQPQIKRIQVSLIVVSHTSLWNRPSVHLSLVFIAYYTTEFDGGDFLDSSRNFGWSH